MGKFDKGKRFGGNRSFSGGGGRGFSGGGRDGRRPMMHKATCSECGKPCELPFRPTGDRPVYCSACFDKQGGAGARPIKFSGERHERPSFKDRKMFDAVCSECGANCQLPFKPSPGKAVFCDNCFDKGGSGVKSGTDYSIQFKMLNEKLDRLIKILAPTEPVALAEKMPKNKVIEKKVAKKTIKAKPVAKKASAKPVKKKK